MLRLRASALAAAGLVALAGCLDPGRAVLDDDAPRRQAASAPPPTTAEPDRTARPAPGLRLPSALQSYGL